MRPVLFATANPGKIMEVRHLLAAAGLPLVTPHEIGLLLNVPEPGATLEENATLKARAYLERLPSGEFVVVADDTGLEIDALGGEPGIHVRHWTGGERMSDEAIIAYCLERLHGVPPAQRGAQFRTALAVGAELEAIALFEGTQRGVILEQPDPLRIEGFPFESLFYVAEWGMLLGAMHLLPAGQKAGFVTHRERALRHALPHIRALCGSA
ncbi:MAG: non-canonical purine NTP pyrophosphatase [Anaerolineae bacterium]|nr:non-canonical purine NTP pyrophosphatase [Anaerolineae bacterium]